MTEWLRSFRRRMIEIERKIRYHVRSLKRALVSRAKRHRFRGWDLEVRFHYPKQRIDSYLDHVFPGYGRGYFRELVRGEKILVDLARVDAEAPVSLYQRITVLDPTLPRLTMKGIDLGLELLYEDDDLVIVDKPAGLLTHPNLDMRTPSVLADLAFRGKLFHPEVFTFESGVIHRLDYLTSGCLCVAKTRAGHQSMRRLFRRRRIEKEYLAIVEGILEGSGTIDLAIGRDTSQASRFRVDRDRGKRAITEYKVLEASKRQTLVGIVLHTGRTHQIRVHFSAVSHPVCGDPIYGRRGTGARPNAIERADGSGGRRARRLMLHARRLAFRHPLRERWIEVEAPRPKDFGFADGDEPASSQEGGAEGDPGNSGNSRAECKKFYLTSFLGSL